MYFKGRKNYILAAICLLCFAISFTLFTIARFTNIDMTETRLFFTYWYYMIPAIIGVGIRMMMN